MPIDIASYRRWEGRAQPTPLSAYAIAATMVRRRMRIRLVRWIVSVFSLLATASAAAAFLFTLEGEGDPYITGQIEAFGLANVNLLAVLNHRLEGTLGWFAILLAALVGAPLIAEDRRAKALPLYFSRPIGHVEYVLGKAASAAFFLALLLVLPRVSMYLVEVAFSGQDGVALRQLPTLLRSLATGGLGIAVLASVALGVSSLTERPTYAALTFLGIAVVASGMSRHLADALRDPDLLVIEPYACVQRIALDLLPVPTQRRPGTEHLETIDVGLAWTGFGIWTALGLFVLVLRVRRVEVVT